MQQQIIPMLSYENGVKAIEWLCVSFGFSKKEESIDETGKLSHGEIEMNGQRIILATPSSDYISPAHVRQLHADTAAMYNTPYIINGLLVYVHNVAEHYAKAKKHGATILSDLDDSAPRKRYRTEDLEGQRWMFMEKPEI